MRALVFDFAAEREPEFGLRSKPFRIKFHVVLGQVRKHVKELKESGKLFEKKERKPGGIMHRIQMAAEQAQKTQQERAQGSTDKPDKNRGPQNFKKRKR